MGPKSGNYVDLGGDVHRFCGIAKYFHRVTVMYSRDFRHWNLSQDWSDCMNRPIVAVTAQCDLRHFAGPLYDEKIWLEQVNRDLLEYNAANGIARNLINQNGNGIVSYHFSGPDPRKNTDADSQYQISNKKLQSFFTFQFHHLHGTIIYKNKIKNPINCSLTGHSTDGSINNLPNNNPFVQSQMVKLPFTIVKNNQTKTT